MPPLASVLQTASSAFSGHWFCAPGLSDAFYCLWVISFVAAIGYLRYVIRHKYDIPAQCCTCDQDGVVDDCCCAFWCGCCATAQMARHEYLEVETGIVRYDCCSATGE